MADLAKRAGPFRLAKPTTDHFQALAESILYQQLAGAAAAAIHRRFLALFDGSLTPEGVMALPEQRLREAGLSGSKAASIRDLAQKVSDGTVPLEGIARLKDDQIVERLSQVRGIGRPGVPDAVRTRVAALLAEDPGVPPGEIARRLREEGMPLGLSTVYRVLALKRIH